MGDGETKTSAAQRPLNVLPQVMSHLKLDICMVFYFDIKQHYLLIEV